MSDHIYNKNNELRFASVIHNAGVGGSSPPVATIFPYEIRDLLLIAVGRFSWSEIATIILFTDKGSFLFRKKGLHRTGVISAIHSIDLRKRLFIQYCLQVGIHCRPK